MARNDDRGPVAPAVLAAPQISLVGEIDRFSVERFQDQLRQAEQMIHCRKLEKQVQLSGPIRSSVPEVEALLHQLQTGSRSRNEISGG